MTVKQRKGGKGRNENNAGALVAPGWTEERAAGGPRHREAWAWRCRAALGLLLLGVAAAGVAVLGWLLVHQLQSLEQLGETVGKLRGRLAELEVLKEQEQRTREQLSNMVELERRLSDLELAQMLSRQKLERASSAAERIVASDPIGKLAAFQAEVKQAISELRGELSSGTELAALQSQLEQLRTTELEMLRQEVAGLLASGSRLEQSVASLTSSLTSAQRSLEENAHSLQAMQQEMEHTKVAGERLENSIGSLSAQTFILEGSLKRTTLLTHALQLQLKENSKALAGLQEVVANQRGSDSSEPQQLENLWVQIQQLQMERSAMQEQVNEALHSIADQRRELQGRILELETAVHALQGHVTQVELGMVSLNTQLSAAVEQQLQGLKLGMANLESSLGTSLQQCLSGEVQTRCENEGSCVWPHVREVSFPHHVPTQPAIVLGLVGLSARGSVGISVRAVDVTDSGFKIHIANMGNQSLSSVRVSWMLCA
ncbi:BICD family-like cargo adapter 1 [Dermochelys coriacea]|uniref:BICD family-like cargo adapter 1 n=1 Tax=Dermochelys coriacea TaxID=27794 RepID=UPI0018E756C8|nr:BICD family-like cargo adapter 1 [Dermochelys coriacea]